MRLAHVVVLSLFGATAASAHVRLDFPTGRYSDDFLKSAPCGKGADDPRSENVSTFAPGAALTVRFTETVNHVGFFRVAFDVDGADFADFEDAANELGRIDDPQNASGQQWTMDVTLPDLECDNCTLQLIQDMGGGTYYQCADLVLQAGAENTPDPNPASGDNPGGCQSSSSTVSAALLLLPLGAWRRRRR